MFHNVFTVSHSVFCTLCYSVSYSVVLCGIKYIPHCFFFVPQCFTGFSQCLTVFFVLCVTLCRTLCYSVTLISFVPQCFTVFFRTLCYSVSYSVVLCGIKLFRSVSFLFHSVSQCFYSVFTVSHSVFFVLCGTLCRTLWYSVELNIFRSVSFFVCFLVGYILLIMTP